MEEILVTVIMEEGEQVLRTREGEYRSLMMLIYDRIYIEDFGECKGMGRCGTCVVECIDTPDDLSRRDRNENTTLRKMGISNARMRLSCQILVDRHLQNAVFAIPAS